VPEVAVDDIDPYLQGKRLYGDDFSAEQIAKWYADEKEGYAQLGAAEASTYEYGYHALNSYHAFRHLRRQTFPVALGFGSAYGDELLPIISQIGQLTVVDPSDAFARQSVHGVPANYIRPKPDGMLPMPDNTFDLITCLGVLHHIPNVSCVVGEFARTLKPGGRIVLREPIVSMGDWRRPRAGLTKRERGIPLPILRTIIGAAGLAIEHESLCLFPLTMRLARMLDWQLYNSGLVTRLDGLLCAAFARNVNYHPRSALQRLRPTSVFLVLRKLPIPVRH
jgi:SAM-dependent methyltransferase